MNEQIRKQKIIVQFNEANFDLIKYYVNQGYNLPFFKKLINEYSEIETFSEEKYENLEPWIQWYSFYTNLPYEEHNVFNLGDSLKTEHKIIFDEHSSKKIAAFASMNLPPRDYFFKYIPDPWTESDPMNLKFKDKYISYAIKQLVNDNASYKLELKSIIGLIFLVNFPKNFNDLKVLVKIIFSIFKKNRAILASSFDYFFSKYCSSEIKRNDLDYSIFFLNGLAHIQHHFLYFSKYYQQSKDNHKLFDSNKKYQTIKSDPILDSITIYDLTFQNLLNCHYDSEIWFITGLTQEKYKQPFYYWRFKNHEEIFNEANIEIESIEPRMTRDFQISFCSTKDLDIAYNFLKESEIINKNNKSPAFGNIQKLGDLKLFCSFIYDQEYEECSLIYKDISINLSNKINFIAIKNGGHISKGWAYTSRKDISKDNKAIWNLSDLIFNK